MYCQSLYELEKKWLHNNNKLVKYATAYNAANPQLAALRFGQWFINYYIKRGTIMIPSGMMKSSIGPDLYYCRDIEICRKVINWWLTNHHYTLTLPVKVD